MEKQKRELNQNEVELMEHIKEQGQILDDLLNRLAALRNTYYEQTHAAFKKGEDPALTYEEIGKFCAAYGLAEDHLKTGVMWLVRAVTLNNYF